MQPDHQVSQSPPGKSEWRLMVLISSNWLLMLFVGGFRGRWESDGGRAALLQLDTKNTVHFLNRFCNCIAARVEWGSNVLVLNYLAHSSATQYLQPSWQSPTIGVRGLTWYLLQCVRPNLRTIQLHSTYPTVWQCMNQLYVGVWNLTGGNDGNIVQVQWPDCNFRFPASTKSYIVLL